MRTAETTHFEFDDISEPGFCFLQVRGPLARTQMEEFSLHAGLMLASEHSKLMVDLTGVPLLRSTYLALLVDLHVRADARRKLVTVVTTRNQAERLRRIGLDRILRLVSQTSESGRRRPIAELTT